MPATWVATRDVPLSDLTRYPGNARRGNVEEIRKSVRRHGQYRAIVVRDTGREGLVILAGNHTFDALTAEGSPTARCEIITCTGDEARRINLADNRLSELGGYDAAALAELLTGLGGDYDGTGWTHEEIPPLLRPWDGSSDPDPSGERGDPEPEDGEETTEVTRGELLALARVTVGEPRHKVEHGQIWALGPHRLVVAEVYTDWPLWAPLLEGDVRFLPYPTPLAPYAPGGGTLIMVQPEKYLAGHLLDKWENITGTKPAIVAALVPAA